jgi:hypothetical protein
MTEHIAVKTVVNIIQDEIRIANQSQKVALQRVLHEVRYVAHRTAHPVEPPMWIRKGDVRIGRHVTTFDSRGETIIGTITAILKYQDGSERIEIKQGTTRTGDRGSSP